VVGLAGVRSAHRLQVDFNGDGRYFSFRALYDDYKTVSLSGIDLDVTVLSDGP
jgi:hypothetical protein